MQNLTSAPHDVLTNPELLGLIFNNLNNPYDIEKARLVCKLWRSCYSVRQLLSNVKENDSLLWKELIKIKGFIKDGKLLFTNLHSDKQNSIDNVVIIHLYNKKSLVTHGLLPSVVNIC